MQLLLVELPLLHPPVDPHNVEEDQEIEDSNQDEEDTGDACADDASDVLHLAIALDHALDDELDRQAKCQRNQKDNGRVPQREEEANPHWLLAVLQEFASRVVDRRDMVSVKGVPQAKGVRQSAETKHRRVARRDIEQQDAPANDVQEQCNDEERTKPPSLTRVESLLNRLDQPTHIPTSRRPFRQ